MANPSIEIQGLEQVISRIKSLPDEGKKQVLTDVAEYSLEVIKEYPPQKFVTRLAAYGKTFFSDKQRRWFFANLREGKISVPYHRTNGLANSWQATIGTDQVKFNTNYAAAPYVVGFAAQSRHEAAVGWKKVDEIVDGKLSFKSSKFRNVVTEAYQRAIRKLKLG